MNTIYKLCIGLCIISNSFTSQSQEYILNYTLESNSLTINNQVSNVISSIKVTDTTLDWVQHLGNASDVTKLTINSWNGSWDYETNSGALTYYLSLEDYSAQLNVSGDGDIISAILTFTAPDGAQETYNFSINGITYQN